jgi:pantoate--beta-alanine ligase
MIRILRDLSAFREACAGARASGLRVGLVPTMGALHEGHLSLVRAARQRAQFVVASIFVNPTQFGPKEDYSRYPRDLEGDTAKLEGAGADAVFAPTVEAMYPAGEQTRVHVASLTDTLCGPHRPEHFEGVATIVAKLFVLTGPCVAVFGRKDYQQLQVIRRLARDLFLPVEVVGVPTVREPDGLAMSSRNQYLSATERRDALALVEGLRAAHRLFAAGERSGAALRAAVRAPIERVATSIDYVELADPDALSLIADGATAGDRAVVAIAARIGATRLIDNAVLGEDNFPGGTA